MNSWRNSILNEFVPKVSKLTLVADPDSLLTEELLALELRERGFDLIEFNDPVEFRFAYESQYRSLWDRGEHTDLVVILRLQDTELEALPFDLLQAGRKLSFNLGELFPALSYPIVEQLDKGLLDALFEAQEKINPDRMGDNATKDFILRNVYEIAAELITTDVQLLRVLLRLHYGKVRLSSMLAHRMIHVLRFHDPFHVWPLEEIVGDEEAFFAFLQERWPVFLANLGQGNAVKENVPVSGLQYPGPDCLPFDHQDIRVYIDNLFLEGKLTPVAAGNIDLETGSWMRSGIAGVSSDDEGLRLSRLFELIQKEFPTPTSRHVDWITFAMKWAELSSLVYCSNNAEHQTHLNEVRALLDMVFSGWLDSHFASLINLPPANPAMLHHLPRRLARDMEDTTGCRIALIVMDGLSLDQWVTVRQLLQKQDANLLIRESATFAWIPTLTSVSRQSIFSSKPPVYFPLSIHSTSNDEKQWKQFWEGHGVSRLDVAYQRGLGDGDASSVIETIVHPGRTKVVGLVVDKIDKIMHGMQLGAAGMHNQIQQWVQKGFLTALVGQLLDNGFAVWLTSDHGNIECTGKGRPSEGVIAETRGERVRVYPSPDLRSQVAASLPFAREWNPVGLPADYFPLIAQGHDAFVTAGETIVGHGGVSVEEVIVPLVKFERKNR
jgi:hypothetical protein